MNKELNRLFSPTLLPFYILLAFLAVLGWVFFPLPAAAAVTLIAAAVILFYAIWGLRRKKQLAAYLKDMHLSSGGIEAGSFPMPMPALILNLKRNEILWCNNAFLKAAGSGKNLFSLGLGLILPGFNADWLTEGSTEAPESVKMRDRSYRVYGTILDNEGENKEDPERAMLLFSDETELLTIRQQFALSRPVAAIIMVDNYDEITSNQPDKSVSGLTARLDDAITAWAGKSNGILRKLERNRYLFIFEERELPHYVEERFSLLDTVRGITNDSGTPATLSIGVGHEGESLSECFDYATLSIEMCLSRGGDQAVVKDRYNFSFYGGKAKEAERRTKVKSRVMAGSLQELIKGSDRVFIMGHKNADLDAVGAAAGVMAICRKAGRDAHIVIDQEKNASGALLSKLKEATTYQGRFLTPEEALMAVRAESLLIVVDTNRPDQVESKELLEKCSRIAVIDHHRRAADYIDNALLNFHEPYASSASELVTELVQYLLDRKDILPCEMLALLAGIVLDTKNFSVRTGARTFEAAAWLRKNGADTVNVKLLFQNDLESTISRYEIIRHAELYRENIALCGLDYTADRITAAQAADELLNISGIQASFVFYPDGDRVICSARSIGEANVQMILEPLGGGGNQATAGAQIPGRSPEEVKEALKASIDAFFSE